MVDQAGGCQPASAHNSPLTADAATLLQVPEIAGHYGILACYGTNGFTTEHLQAIKELGQLLEEIIIFFDGDPAGRKGSRQLAEKLGTVVNCKLSIVNCPEGEDINSLSQSHEPAIFLHLV